MVHRTARTLVAALAGLVTVVSCSDGTAPTAPLASITLYSITPATVRSLLVQVSGPGISPTLTVNVPVDSAGVASGTIRVLPGVARQIVVSAFDTSGIVSHMADTTVRLLSGNNPTLTLVLKPLVASAPIVVTFGSIGVVVTGGPTTMVVGDTATYIATVSGVYGGPVPPDSIAWGSSDPSALRFVGAVATAFRAGSAIVTASFRGVTATRSVTISPDTAITGTFLIEVNGTSCCEQLSLFRLPGGAASVVIPSPSGQGDLTPDKSAIAFWRPFDNRIFKSTATGANEVVIASGAIHYTPRWSASGQTLTLTREVGGGATSREIFLMNADGSGLTRLTNNGAEDGAAHLSPDGTRIVFVSGRDGNLEVYVMNSDGTNPLRLTNAPGLDAEPSWSPDGTRILFTSDRAGAPEIFSMAPDGSAVTQLTTGSGSPVVQIGRWSPDGQRISFARASAGVSAVWTAKADGSDARKLRATPVGVSWEYVRSWRTP